MDEDAAESQSAITHIPTPLPNGPRLRGFLFRSPDLLRLYVDRERDGTRGTAADVRPTGAMTALLAALDGLLDEDEHRRVPTDDPHGTRLLDFTDW
ncbi:hypothetical protein [Streptomyces sp. 4F14]|uniref:hypothetical protein n=1 Tax=Streptomyces sp. 4F14 TaxID=3394380 RepID=UPI003A8AEF2B